MGAANLLLLSILPSLPLSGIHLLFLHNSGTSAHPSHSPSSIRFSSDFFFLPLTHPSFLRFLPFVHHSPRSVHQTRLHVTLGQPSIQNPVTTVKSVTPLVLVGLYLRTHVSIIRNHISDRHSARSYYPTNA